jgi:hypothetical protein
MPRDAARLPSGSGRNPSKTAHFLNFCTKSLSTKCAVSGLCLRLDAMCTETHQQPDLSPNLHPSETCLTILLLERRT